MTSAIANAVPDLDNADAGTLMNYFRSHLEQVVTLHTAMFQKLLFEGAGVPLELAELFEDAGNTYVKISESISKYHRQRHASEVEEQLDADIEAALGRIEPQLGIKPRVRRAKHLAEPVED